MSRGNRSLAAPAATAGESIVIDVSQPVVDGGSSAGRTRTQQARGGAAPTGGTQPQTVRPPRPRILVPEERMEEALQMCHESKINTRNAWTIQLLEGMAQSVTSVMNTQRADNYAQFTRAAHLVEGGAKVWTQRVESTYLLSSQIVRRLLRNDGTGDGEDRNTGEGGDGADAQDADRNRRKRRSALQRTVAETLEEINYDGWLDAVRRGVDAPGAAAAALGGLDAAATQNLGTATQASTAGPAFRNVNPSFRAITEKFDQSHAQGLLLHNAPIGVKGNLILDRDYARLDVDVDSGAMTDSVRPSLVRLSGFTAKSEARGAADEPDATRPSFGGQCAFAEMDEPCERVRLSAHSVAAMMSVARPSRVDLNAAAAAARRSVGPHIGNPEDELSTSPTRGAPGQRASSVFSHGDAMNRDHDFDDEAGGADFDHYDADDGNDGGDPSQRLSRAASLARGLVTGALEMDAYDNAWSRNNDVCALMAEDPDNWVPLVQAPAGSKGVTGIAGALSQGMIGLIRKQHAPRKSGGAQAAVGDDPNDDGAPALKRRRTEKKPNRFVAEDVTGCHYDTKGGLQQLQKAGAAKATEEEERLKLALRPNEDALKQNRTQHAARLAIAKDFDKPDALKKYTEPVHCQSRALNNGLLLPSLEGSVGTSGSQLVPDAAAGPSVRPAWLPSRLAEDPSALFQPFATSAKHWNVLQKTARLRQAQNDAGAGRRFVIAGNDLDGDHVVGDLPVADDERFDYDDGDDGDDYQGPDASTGFYAEAARQSAGEGEAAALAPFALAPGGLALPEVTLNASPQRPSQVVVANGAASTEALRPPRPSTDVTLRVQHATAPTLVDVARLRNVMWDKTKRAAQRQPPPPRTGSEDVPPAPRLPNNATFTDVIRDMLPEVPSIAKDGSLSPAFFFFSLLFLANEHNLALTQQQVDTATGAAVAVGDGAPSATVVGDVSDILITLT